MCFSQITPPRVFTSQTSLSTHFSKAFQGVVSGTTQSAERGFVMSEVAGTVTDMVKRASTIQIGDPGYITFPTAFDDTASNELRVEPFHYFTSMFAFWRGSRSMRHYQDCRAITLTQSPSITPVPIYAGMGCSYFFTDTDVKLLPLEKVNVPWYSTVPWCVTFNPGKNFHPSMYSTEALPKIPTDVNMFNFDLGSDSWSVHAGDDFMALHPLPFFPIFDLPPPPRKQETTAQSHKKDKIRTNTTTSSAQNSTSSQ